MKLEGSRAKRGIALTDFDTFIQNFLRGVRDFERSRRNAPTRKTGRAERSAAAATAFRLVRLKPGSAIAYIEPDVDESLEEHALQLDDGIPFPVQNLVALVDELDGNTLPSVVGGALKDACRALGADGSISLTFPQEIRKGQARIDEGTIERATRDDPVDAEVTTTIVGRLHRLELEPEKIGVRTASGVDWRCSYLERLEPKVLDLVGKIVVVKGEGHKSSPLRGTLAVEDLEPVQQGEQTPLFTVEQVADEDLLADQGIDGPQGLASLQRGSWGEADEAYMAALLDN
jgi:hypothetical protein